MGGTNATTGKGKLRKRNIRTAKTRCCLTFLGDPQRFETIKPKEESRREKKSGGERIKESSTLYNQGQRRKGKKRNRRAARCGKKEDRGKDYIRAGTI